VLAFICTLLLSETSRNVLGIRREKKEAKKNLNARLRRSDDDNVTGDAPIPGLQVSEKTGRSDFSSMPIDRWSHHLALLELGPPPWWTPSSPTRTRAVRTRPFTTQSVTGVLDPSSDEKTRAFAAQVLKGVQEKTPDDKAWLQQYNHIEEDVTYNNLGEEILTFPERRPRLFNAMLGTFKTWAADAFVQTFQNRKNGLSQKFDWNRSLVFALFGLLYIGLIQWVLYVSVLTWLFPDAMIFANAPMAVKLRDRTGLYDMVGQITVDMFFFNVFIYFPVFYIIKAMFQEKGSVLSRAHAGLSKYWTNIYKDNIASTCLWMPADVVIFACPMYLRMPFEHAVSFGWTMFMSATRGGSEKSEVEKSGMKLEAKEPYEGGCRDLCHSTCCGEQMTT